MVHVPRATCHAHPWACSHAPGTRLQVHALKSELGLPMDSSMAEAVAAANRVVGLDSIGTLSDQVGRLLRETGVKPARGAAPVAAAATANGSPGRATAVSAGTETEPAAAAAAGSRSRPVSRGGGAGAGTQTQPAKSFYERFLEQKRKDGLID